MRPAITRQSFYKSRQRRAAQSVASGSEHDASRKDLEATIMRSHAQHDETIGAWRHGFNSVAVADIECQHAAIPDQILHPLQTVDLVERLPGWRAELSLEPCAKRQRR